MYRGKREIDKLEEVKDQPENSLKKFKCRNRFDAILNLDDELLRQDPPIKRVFALSHKPF